MEGILNSLWLEEGLGKLWYILIIEWKAANCLQRGLNIQRNCYSPTLVSEKTYPTGLSNKLSFSYFLITYDVLESIYIISS